MRRDYILITEARVEEFILLLKEVDDNYSGCDRSFDNSDTFCKSPDLEKLRLASRNSITVPSLLLSGIQCLIRAGNELFG